MWTLERCLLGPLRVGACVALLVSAPLLADVADPRLDRWLVDTAAPTLAERLRSHPRLKGEALEVGTAAAYAGRSPDRLGVAVAARLAAALRAHRGVHLAVAGANCEAERPLQLLVDVQTADSRHRVELAFLDARSGLWLGGLGIAWEGELSASARRLLRETAPQTVDGTEARPYPAGAEAAAAARLAAALRCALARPHGWGGGMTLAPTAGDPLVDALRTELAGDLTAAGAAWTLRLRREADAALLEVAPTAGGAGAAVEVARVWLHTPAPQPRIAAASVQQPASAPSSAPLIRELALVPAARAGICERRGAPGEACWDVRLTLTEPAWSMLAWTAGPPEARRLNVNGCVTALPTPQASRRFRIWDEGGELGVYVLVTRDAATARTVRRLLTAAPGRCTGNPGVRRGDTGAFGLSGWLRRLDERLAALDQPVEWRFVSSDDLGAATWSARR